MKIKQVLIVSSILLLAACGGQSGGFAPSAPAPPIVPPVVDNSGDQFFKYGQTSSTAAGWEVTLDTSDPVEELVLGNGWTAEVKHE